MATTATAAAALALSLASASSALLVAPSPPARCDVRTACLGGGSGCGSSNRYQQLAARGGRILRRLGSPTNALGPFLRRRARVGVGREAGADGEGDNSRDKAEKDGGRGSAAVDPATYVFGRPGEFSGDLEMLGTTPRRLALGSFVAIGLALGGNFASITDALVSMAPENSRSLHLDALYAVQGLKGYYTDEYVLRYPRDWLFDQSIAQAKIQAYRREAEARRGRGEWWDLSSDSTVPKPSSVIPDAAFGPPKGGKYENLSVVKQKVLPVESLDTLLGEPQMALEKLLSTSIAPEGSGKRATILGARKREGDSDEQNLDGRRKSLMVACLLFISRNGEEIYEFEYKLDLPNGRKVHTWSNVGLKQPEEGRLQPNLRRMRDDASSVGGMPLLLTMTFVVPEESLNSDKVATIVKASREFHVL